MSAVSSLTNARRIHPILSLLSLHFPSRHRFRRNHPYRRFRQLQSPKRLPRKRQHGADARSSAMDEVAVIDQARAQGFELEERGLGDAWGPCASRPEFQ